MSDSELTDRAIAELMRELDAQNPSHANKTQCERKVNPLGKTNKRFLGRTINNALSHNKREKERTAANCQRKLKDLDEQRKVNQLYHRNRSTSRSTSRRLSRSRSRSRNRSVEKRRSRTRSRSRSPHRRRSKKKSKRSRRKERKRSVRSRSRSTSRSSYRSRSSRRKKHKKSSKKHKKNRRRPRSSLRSRSHSSYETNPSFNDMQPVPPPSEVFLDHSKQMALVVAMAYSQALNTKIQRNDEERASSPLSDIVKELMSDDDESKNMSLECLSISSNEEPTNLLTIDVSSNSEGNEDSESSDSESQSSSCIELDSTSDSNNNSDIEIVECQSHEINKPETSQKPKELSESLPSVDLTDD
ncbi:arginine/serine-rich coiled-coil protein 2 [Drosophila bipectinata]|uniref:arginine/serine-rich coiled-coil protein 2 n=1 Tax=Drosophila bipectinata TaxID=42026 RepID=UPI001C8A63FC|nr:serine/arginine-rich splicing factor 4 [Drosophila bipectinata]